MAIMTASAGESVVRSLSRADWKKMTLALSLSPLKDLSTRSEGSQTTSGECDYNREGLSLAVGQDRTESSPFAMDCEQTPYPSPGTSNHVVSVSGTLCFS